MKPTVIKQPNIPIPCEGRDMLQPRRSRLFTGGPSLEFVTVNVPTVNGQIATDLLVQFQVPHEIIFISSVTDAFQAASIYFHLNPLGLASVYAALGSNIIVLTGSEHYLPMWKTNAIGGGMQSRYIRFKTRVQQFYIDADHQAGNPAGGYFITFGGTDDIELMNIMQGSNS